MNEQPPVPDATPGNQPERQPAEGSWNYSPQVSSAGGDIDQQVNPVADTEGVNWTASEFIAHAKSASWYFALAGGAIVVAALVYLVTRDKISTAAVIVAAIFFGIFAARKPRTLNYALNPHGLKIGAKYYSLSQFKSFSLIHQGAFSGILLLPLQRFKPPLEIYYDPKDEERITAILSEGLPFEDRKPDPVENFVRRIRF